MARIDGISAARVAAVLVVQAAPGGSTEALCREAAARGQPRFTLADPANANLLALGFAPAAPADAGRLLQRYQSATDPSTCQSDGW